MAGESTFGILNVDLSEQLGEKIDCESSFYSTIFVPMKNDHWVVNPPVSDTRHILGHWTKMRVQHDQGVLSCTCSSAVLAWRFHEWLWVPNSWIVSMGKSPSKIDDDWGYP